MDDFNYQKEAARTLIFEPDREIPDYELNSSKYVVFLFCKIGEIAEYVKKAVFHQRGLDSWKLWELLAELKKEHKEFNEYNHNLSGRNIMVLWVLTGLIGEVGEIAKLLFDYLFLGKELSREEMIKELGDQSWYSHCLATLLNIDMDEVLKTNVEKLRKRYPTGYNVEDSKLRRDVNG